MEQLLTLGEVSRGLDIPTAFELQIVDQKVDEYGHDIWAWHIARLKRLLEQLGDEGKSDTLTHCQCVEGVAGWQILECKQRMRRE